MLVYKTISQELMLGLKDLCNNRIHRNQINILIFSNCTPGLKVWKFNYQSINLGTSSKCQYTDLVITECVIALYPRDGTLFNSIS